MKRKLLAMLLCTSAATLLGQPAFAQAVSEPEDDVSEVADRTDRAPAAVAHDNIITVTAQRRQERLVDVPIAISTITRQEMNSAGITTTTDIDRVTPGLTFTTQASHAQPNIRGVGSQLTGPGADNNVAVYVDGVYQAAQSGLFMDFNNIEQIEVLKGPQGTLFGRNATGGAIRIQTRDPAFTPSVEVGATYGRFDDLKLTGYVNVPVSENVAINFAGLYRDGPDYITNLFNDEKIPGQKSYAGQAKLLIEPTENFRVILSGFYMDREDQRNEAFAPYQGGNAYAANPSFEVPGPYEVNQDQQPLFEVDVRSANLRTELELDLGTISTTTAYIDYDGNLGFDLDQSPGTLGFAQLIDSSETFSQELNFASRDLGGFAFVAGLYYYHENAGRDQPIGPSLGATPFLRTLSGVTTDAYAIYAEGTVDVTDRLHVTAGARYSFEEKEGFGRRLAGAGAPVELSDSWGSFTPRLAVRYELSDASNVYASYSKGFKSGVFNVAGLQAAPVAPEYIDAFEVGYKVASRNLRFSSSAFYYDYTDIQVQSQLSAATLVFQNAAAATIYGADFDISVDLTDEFTVRGGAAYTHGRYDEFPGALTTAKDPVTGAVSIVGYLDQSGNVTVRTPEFSGNISIDYNREFDAGTFGVTSTLSYASKYFSGPDNRAFVPGTEQLSGEVSWTTADDRYRFALWGKNLTDQERILFLTTGAAGDFVIYDTPRTYGISVDARF